MKLLIFTKNAVATAAFSLFAVPALADVCPLVNGAVDLSNLGDGTSNGDYNCDYTPDGMNVKLYKIMLCEEYPTVSSYSTACSSLVDFPSGRDVNITADGTSPILDQDVTLTEGIYTHAVIVISNKIASKFTQTFTQPIQGNDGVGTTCWSNGNDAAISYETALGVDGYGDYTKFSASCGTAAEADPSWSYYTYKGLWNPGAQDSWSPTDSTKVFYISSTPYLALGYEKNDLHLLSNFTTLASVASGEAGRNRDDENGIITDAQYMMGVTRFTTPANINPNTQNIDLGFKLKDTFFQKITTNDYYGVQRCSDEDGTIGESSVTGAHACLSTSYATRFDFKFEVR